MELEATGSSGARHTARPGELVCGHAPWALRPSCSVRRTCPHRTPSPRTRAGRLSDRFLAQGSRGRERVNTARSDPTAAVTIAYLSPAQGLLRRRRHGPGGRGAGADLLWQLARYHRRHDRRPARSETGPRALPPTADDVRVLPTGSQPRSPMRGSNRARGSLECGRGGASPCQDGCA
jgi:hypothetical protein